MLFGVRAMDLWKKYPFFLPVTLQGPYQIVSFDTPYSSVQTGTFLWNDVVCLMDCASFYPIAPALVWTCWWEPLILTQTDKASFYPNGWKWHPLTTARKELGKAALCLKQSLWFFFSSFPSIWGPLPTRPSLFPGPVFEKQPHNFSEVSETNKALFRERMWVTLFLSPLLWLVIFHFVQTSLHNCKFLGAGDCLILWKTPSIWMECRDKIICT